jgi:protein ImuB
MRRILYLWLKHWPLDRRRRATPRQPNNSAAPAEAIPFATVIDIAGRHLLAAVNPPAAAKGLMPGMPLADALSLLPGLAVAAAQPAADAAALRRLAEWCGRYSPWTAPDGADGVKIEITGCAHLWGGEAKLAADLRRRLARQTIAGRIAVADTLGAAWAFARFAPRCEPTILPPGTMRTGLAPLPIEALRLDPVTVQGLRRVGLRRIGELCVMPRDALARRFGDQVMQRLEQALGDRPEPLSPLAEPPVRRVRLSFAEPIADPADLARAAERLAADLVRRLARQGTGARRLDLAFHRVDGRVEHIVLGTARPSRDPQHIAALFKERLDGIDPGLGIEDVILAAFAVEPLPPEQIGLAGAVADNVGSGGLAPLLDRLGNRLGLEALSRLEARASHIPERAAARVPVDQSPSPSKSGKAPLPPERPAGPPARADVPGMGEGGPPRPIRLFEPPEPIEVFWLLPDDPPFRFIWRRCRHRVSRADGPERIAEEWWRPTGSGMSLGTGRAAVRDYYRVEDTDGRRFWLFRAGLAGGDPPPRWYLHGVFC